MPMGIYALPCESPVQVAKAGQNGMRREARVPLPNALKNKYVVLDQLKRLVVHYLGTYTDP